MTDVPLVLYVGIHQKSDSIMDTKGSQLFYNENLRTQYPELNYIQSK